FLLLFTLLSLFIFSSSRIYPQLHSFPTRRSSDLYNLKKSDKAAFYSILDLAEGVVVKGGVFQSCDGSVLLLSSIGNTYPAKAGNNELHFLEQNFNHAHMLNTEKMSFCIKSRDDYLQAAGMTGMKIIKDRVLLNADISYGNTEPIITFDFIDFVAADGEEYRYKINGNILYSKARDDYEEYNEVKRSKYFGTEVKVHRNRDGGYSSEVFRILPNDGMPGSSWLPHGHRFLNAMIYVHTDSGILIN